MFNVVEFLKSFHGGNKVHFRALKKDSKGINLNGTYEELESELNKLNNDGFDIYFVVNSGGTKNYQINKINSVYIDFDCGKDANKQYHPLEQTQKFKDECLKKVNNFKFKPSYIVETRNGIHVYWIVENGTNEQFEQCQLQLIQYFNSDPAVTTVERIMRLPGHYWTKDINNKYMSKILNHNNIKYDICDLIDHLPDVEIDKSKKQTKNKTNNENKAEVTPIKHTLTYTNNIPYIKDGLTRHNGAEVLQKVIMANRLKVNLINSITLNKLYNDKEGVSVSHERDNTNINVSLYGHQNPYLMDEVQFGSHSEVYDHLKKQDLMEYLGVDEHKICCLFHKDENPSASIFQDPNTGYWWYKCFSPSCSLNKNVSKFSKEKKSEVDIRAKDIIAITERLLRCNRTKALRFLRKVYNINYFETEWQKEQREMLDENIRLLTININDFEAMYPNLYKKIKLSKKDLIELNLFAKEFVLTENFTDTDDNSVFYASLDRLCKLFDLSPSSAKNVVRKLGVFSFLGILNKLTAEDIPTPYLKTAKHFAALNKQVNIIGFYSVPSYSDELLSYAEEMAMLFDSKNMSVRGFSRELLVRTFDEEFANKIFPQTKKKKLTKKSEIRTEQIHKITSGLIEQYGYAIEKDIVAIIAKMYDDIGQKYSEEQLFLQIKKSLPEMLETYNWERVRLNKKWKETLNIDSLVVEGFPFVIIKK